MWARTSAALVEPDDLASIIEVMGLAVIGRHRVIDRREGAALEQEAVANEVGIDGEARNVTAVVDADGRGECGARNIVDGRKGTALGQEGVERSLGIEVGAQNLTASAQTGT